MAAYRGMQSAGRDFVCNLGQAAEATQQWDVGMRIVGTRAVGLAVDCEIERPWAVTCISGSSKTAQDALLVGVEAL